MKKKRPVARRSTEEIRRLILDSARHLFGERGYSETTTKSIAERASITEPLIFRNFGSKAQLFEQAIATPIERQFIEFNKNVELSRVSAHGSREIRIADFVESLYARLREDRSLVRALFLSMQSGDPELNGLLHQPHSPIIAYLDKVGDMGRQAFSEVGWHDVDPFIAARITFGFVLMLAVFDDFLFPADRGPSRTELLREMTAYATYGLSSRPARGGKRSGGASAAPRNGATRAAPKRRPKRKASPQAAVPR